MNDQPRSNAQGNGRPSRGRRPNWRGRHSWRGRGRGGNQNSQAAGSSSGYRSQNVVIETSRPTVVSGNHLPSPYKKWSVYFTEEAYQPISPTTMKIEAFKKYFNSTDCSYSFDTLENKQIVNIDFAVFTSNEDFKDQFPDLKVDIHMQPELHVKCIGLALHETLLEHRFHSDGLQASLIQDIKKIHVRYYNLEHLTALKNIKANCFGRLVSIRGTVVRVGNCKPLAINLAFSCSTCKDTQVLCLKDGRFTYPTKCLSPECRSRSFQVLRSSHLTETVDWQNIRLQEIMKDDQRESGRIPRTIECELSRDLVDSCVPGDVITVTGIVNALNSEDNAGRSKDKCMFLLYLVANSISNDKDKQEDHHQDAIAAGSEFTLKELYAIQEIQSEEDLFRLIVGSTCPSIYGHELVKAGLILALFGGTRRDVDEKNGVSVRSDPHILVVGDPGLGKSQMLQAVSNLAPRGVYVCGNTTTTSGLTVTLSKESGSADYALEAGALVLGDQGCCCIDEFDKMGNQHQALLEAMEQQSISIAKAGIVCSLPARTSILAAANPVGGHYNKAKTVSENVKMNPALLSRFDLVFILLDKPDEELDDMLSSHVMSMHATGRNSFPQQATARRSKDPNESQQTSQARGAWEKDKPLSDRLKIHRGESLDYIPSQLLRKYIAYARKYVRPSLSPAAAEVLKSFYLNLRQQHKDASCTPITTRQLESLIRLSEARAKLELREIVTSEDAQDVVHIMRHSLIDTYSDDIGVLDFQRSQNGSGMSQRGQSKKFVTALSRIAERDNSTMFTVDQMREVAKMMKLQLGNFDDFVMSLNNQNYLLKKGPRLYKLQTVS